MRADLAQQVLGVARLAGDLEARLLEQARETLAQQHGVIGQHDAERVAHERGLYCSQSSSWMRAPESSALGTNPRAPERATSGPKSDESRLETSTMSGPLPLVSCAGDLEAVDVGQLDVEEDEVGPQPLGLGDA